MVWIGCSGARFSLLVGQGYVLNSARIADGVRRLQGGEERDGIFSLSNDGATAYLLSAHARQWIGRRFRLNSMLDDLYVGTWTIAPTKVGKISPLSAWFEREECQDFRVFLQAYRHEHSGRIIDVNPFARPYEVLGIRHASRRFGAARKRTRLWLPDMVQVLENDGSVDAHMEQLGHPVAYSTGQQVRW